MGCKECGNSAGRIVAMLCPEGKKPYFGAEFFLDGPSIPACISPQNLTVGHAAVPIGTERQPLA
jgi:hypothetical protein